MTRLGEEYTFDSMCLKPFFRLPIACCHDQFLINVSKNSVVKIGERKLLRTWTLKHPHSFTCPVVFNAIDSSICCIIDNNILVKWFSSTDTLEDATKIKFQESVFGIIPISAEKLILIFNSGKCLLFDHAMTGMKPSDSPWLKPEEKLIWADASVHNSEISVLYLSLLRKGRQYNYTNFTVSIEDGAVKGISSQILSQDTASLKSWCMSKCNENASLLTVWSDGKIVSNSVSDNSSKTILFLPDIQKSNLLAIDVIDSSHIAILKVNSENQEYILEIWDIKFSALKAKRSLKVPSSDPIQVSVKGSTIFLSSSDNLVSVPVQVERSTLATAIGKSNIDSKEDVNMIYAWSDEGNIQELSSLSDQTNLFQSVDLSELKAQKLIEELLTKIENGHLNSIQCSNLKNITESELVQALLYAIKFKGDAETENQEKNDMQSKQFIISNIIFSAPFSDVFLVNHLRKLTLEETLVVLELLLCYLNDTFTTSKAFLEKPSDLQIVSWVYLVIQSHTEELLLSKDREAAKLLETIYTAVSDKMKAYEDLEKIDYLLKLQKKKNILPEKIIREKYCIELLYI